MSSANNFTATSGSLFAAAHWKPCRYFSRRLSSGCPGWPQPEKIPNSSRVYLACPGCKQTLEVLSSHIDTIPNCEPDYAQHARLVAIKPPDPTASAESKWRNHGLSMEIHRKNRMKAELGDDWERYLPVELRRGLRGGTAEVRHYP